MTASRRRYAAHRRLHPGLAGSLFLAALCLRTPADAQSPHTICMTRIAVWGQEGGEPGALKQPEALAVDPSGFLYIADTGNQRIQKWGPDGAFITEVGGFGWSENQFDHPAGIWAENGLDVFIADHLNNRIVRYDKDLHYLGSLSSGEDWPDYLQFGFPRDVALSTQGELFCVDGENQRVLMLDIQGHPLRAFGGYDDGMGRLLRPEALLLDGNRRIYVTDSRPACVKVYDAMGNFLQIVGENHMQSPRGLALLQKGWIVIADPEAGRCTVLDERGRFVNGLWIAEHSADDLQPFSEPVDVAVRANRIYVLDRGESAVNVFEWLVLGEDPD